MSDEGRRTSLRAMKVKEWSEETGQGQRTLRKAIANGELAVVRKGRSVLIMEEDMREFLLRDRVPATESQVA